MRQYFPPLFSIRKESTVRCSLSILEYEFSKFQKCIPDTTSAMHPQQLGEDIEVPFIKLALLNVQFGTDAIAPPMID